MSESTLQDVSRRGFLGRAFALAWAMPFVPGVWPAPARAAETAASLSSSAEYHCLNPGEAAFIEKMVNTLCPADHLTPDGVSCGLATFIDRHLAGHFNDGVAPPEHAGHTQLFKVGLAAADEACQARFGMAFALLSPADAREFLRLVATGEVSHEFPLASWSTQVVDPLLTQACYAGPFCDTHGTRMFWKLFGYVSGPARLQEL
jgi:gluconate 2-dehydrogenase gamma chain